VVLSVGMQMGAIDRSLYSLKVAMTVITTTMARPALTALAVPSTGPSARGESPRAGKVTGPTPR
jgi:hypothetical protein